jgi:hypothetical protein
MLLDSCFTYVVPSGHTQQHTKLGLTCLVRDGRSESEIPPCPSIWSNPWLLAPSIYLHFGMAGRERSTRCLFAFRNQPSLSLIVELISSIAIHSGPNWWASHPKRDIGLYCSGHRFSWVPLQAALPHRGQLGTSGWKEPKRRHRQAPSNGAPSPDKQRMHPA